MANFNKSMNHFWDHTPLFSIPFSSLRCKNKSFKNWKKQNSLRLKACAGTLGLYENRIFIGIFTKTGKERERANIFPVR